MRVMPEIERELAERVEGLGYELVEVRWGGVDNALSSSFGSTARTRAPAPA